jgi:hypothetical protein
MFQAIQSASSTTEPKMKQKDKQEHKTMHYTHDELGHEILLKNGNLQVMMEWEKPYMQACIDTLKPKGDVLEIGFGLGYSSTQIQKYHPKSHTIIECDPTVIQKAKEWAKTYAHVKIVEGFWQDQLEKLGNFDTIFFDDYTPFSAEEVQKIEADAHSIQQAVSSAKKTNKSLASLFNQLKDIKFTDDQVVEFVHYLNNAPKNGEKPSSEEVISFIQTLVEQGNMTILQEVQFMDEYEKMQLGQDCQRSNKETLSDQVNKESTHDRLLHFFQLSLDHHMRKGACMSSYIDLKQFKKNYKQFETLILSRPDVDCKQQVISVSVPPNCEYYSGNEALVLTITKK